MSKMNLFERMAQCYARGEQMPIKGHAKIILADPITGKPKEIVESDNMVTNAVADILSKNWSRIANFGSSNISPLRKLFSGVMCFQNEITENANNYNPPADNVNPMIAHAGDAPNDTASVLRGSPVPSDFEITDTSIKQVWFWPTTAGNGTIRNVSLCAGSHMGNMGLKPFNDEFSPLSAIGEEKIFDNTWNETISKQFPFTINANGKESCSIWIDGSTFKENKVRHDYLAFGIMRGVRDWQDISTRSATIRSGNNRFVFDDANYYYIARASSATALQIDKVAKSDFSVTQTDISYANVSLWTGNFHSNFTALNGDLRIFAFDGTHLYYPKSDLTGFYKLNIADNSDKDMLDGSVTVETGANNAGAGGQFMSPLVINSGLVLGSNYLINGGAVYPIGHAKDIGIDHTTATTDANYLWLVRNGASVYGHAKHTAASYSVVASGQANVLCETFLSTINNIDPVVKSTSQTMSIIYTLQEV